MRRPHTICIDFDGTIVEHKFPSIGPLKPGAKEAIARLYEKYVIVISSCRSSKMFRRYREYPDYVQEMHTFLIENDIRFDRVDEGHEGKVVAVAYIDDRGIRFKDNWGEIADLILGSEESEKD